MLYQNEEVFVKSHSMVQAVNCWPFTAEAGLQSQESPCGICGGQISNGTRFSLSIAGLLQQWPGFSPRKVHAGFVVDKLALQHVFLSVLRV